MRWERRIVELDAKFNRRIVELDAKRKKQIGSLKAESIKWMFLFWVGTVGTVITVMRMTAA